MKQVLRYSSEVSLCAVHNAQLYSADFTNRVLKVFGSKRECRDAAWCVLHTRYYCY